MSTTIETASRTDWLRARQQGVGASESAALFGVHPYISMLSLYESKIAEIQDDLEGNERMEDGKVIEPRIAARYEKKTGNALSVPEGLPYFNTRLPHMFCSPDRMRRDSNGFPVPVELKWWDNFREGDEIPEYGQIQLQHQMAVLDSTVGDMAILGSFRSFHTFLDIERHDMFIAILAEKVQYFWDCVETRTPPAIDGSDATAAALKRLYPKDNGATIFLPSEATAWIDDMEAAKIAEKEAKARVDFAKNQITAAIGDNTFGVLSDGRKYSWKHQKRESYVVAETEFRVLRKGK